MMSVDSFGIRPCDSPAISERIVSTTLNAIQKLLPAETIERLCRQVGYLWRERTLSPAVTVLHMILAAIWPEESFNASWQVLWAAVSSRYPELAGKSPSRGSVSKARARLPLALWEQLFAVVSRQAQALAEGFACWKDHRVVLLDGTCVSMPDEPELAETFGVNTGYRGKGRYPLARVATFCLAGTMSVIAYAVGGYRQSESALAFPLLSALRTGDLLLADRYFAAAHFYWRYRLAGLEFLTRIHQRLKIARIKRVCSYGPGDFIGWLKISPIYRRKDPSLPEKFQVRFVRASVRIRGRQQTIWLATSLLDAQRYPAAEVVAVYARRWRIETVFEQLKVRLSADVLRSRSAESIRKELAARFIALNLVHSVILESARAHDVEPLRISFAHAVRAILAFSPALANEPLGRLPAIYSAMLSEIAHHLVPERAGRNEPRAIRRDRKHYPTLKTTRAEWRKRHAA
ncbi:MAG: IS4 family transposase [Phycisphaerales bacterium]